MKFMQEAMVSFLRVFVKSFEAAKKANRKKLSYSIWFKNHHFTGSNTNAASCPI